jgi:PKD repeat protein
MLVIIYKFILLSTMPPFLGIMRTSSASLVSSESAIGLTATAVAIAVMLLTSNVTIISAQQQQLTSQSEDIEIRTIAQSTKDNFRVQVPQSWIIQDVNNTGSALVAEVLDGFGILAQLCPEEEEQQGAALSNASGSTNNNSCQGAQEEVIHIVRYPNLGAILGISSEDIVTNDDITSDTILAYQMQKLQEAGYRDIRIVDSTDTTINVDTSTGMDNNNNDTVTATVPAKHVEMTYSTDSAPDETRRGYLISAATGATASNLGTITGYTVFYESTSPSSTSAVADEEGEETMLPVGSLLLPEPVTEVFDSFELIAGADVVQAIGEAALEEEGEEAALEEEGEEAALASPLTVQISSNGTEGAAPATFVFLVDVIGGIEPYSTSWDFDDDSGEEESEEQTSEESEEQTILHTFDEAGTYNVTLTITDSEDQTASDSIEVTVEEPSEEGEGVEEEGEAVEEEAEQV